MKLNKRIVARGSRWRLLSIALIGAGLAFIGVTLAPARAPAPPWSTDWNKSLAAAAKEKKPIIAMFSADWCPPCKMMKKEVFPLPEVREALKSWAAIYMEETKNFKKMGEYTISSFPTFVVMSSDGEEVGRFSGGRFAEQFLQLLSLYKEAVPRLSQIKALLAKNPQQAALWKEYGDLLNGLEQMDQAYKVYKQALKLDPDNRTGVAADVGFFDALMMLGMNEKKGLQLLVELAKSYPESSRVGDALFVRGVVAKRGGREDESLALIEQYLAQFPQGSFRDSAIRVQAQLAKSQSPEM